MPKDNAYPAFLFYPEDFASDGKVEMMSTEEVGAYILLMCKAWREDPTGTLPDNDSILARWARLTSPRWAKCKANVLAAFYMGEDSRWHQKRLEIEFKKLQAKKEKRSNAAQIAAEARWEEDAKRKADASDSHPIRIPPDMRMDAIEWKGMEGNGTEEKISEEKGEADGEGSQPPQPHWAVAMYAETYGRIPPLHGQELIVTAVKDRDVWRRTLDIWRGNNHDAEKYGNIVDRYKRELKLASERPASGGTNGSKSKTVQRLERTAERRAREDAEDRGRASEIAPERRLTGSG